jgi:hypothetical protein
VAAAISVSPVLVVAIERVTTATLRKALPRLAGLLTGPVEMEPVKSVVVRLMRSIPQPALYHPECKNSATLHQISGCKWGNASFPFFAADFSDSGFP